MEGARAGGPAQDWMERLPSHLDAEEGRRFLDCLAEPDPSPPRSPP
jgi:hypothetical protein